MVARHVDTDGDNSPRPESDAICVAHVSTYPPRQCGLAQFCDDLVKWTSCGRDGMAPLVVAMERRGQPHAYPEPVALTVTDDNEAEYEAAAQFINQSSAQIVVLQHEFGIFGGTESRLLLRLFDGLRKPVVTVLHTVLEDPEAPMREMLGMIARRSARLVVMNSLARPILGHDYGIHPERIRLVHHGAPAPQAQDRESVRVRLGLTGRRVLSTFGLVGRGKGLEYVIRALPAVRERHPDVCYLIVGQTHPGVRQAEKESYRDELRELARSLKLDDSVRFINRYLEQQEIVEYLAATDIYLTPYLNPHQITSGTLAYAMASGKAIVSTPYRYARFLLAEDRGILVPTRSEEAIATAVNRVLDRPELQRQYEARAGAYGSQMFWPKIAARYRALFREVLAERRSRRPLATPVEHQQRLAIPSGG